MVGVISQVENGCYAVANSLLVLVPHKTLHGTISILIQRTKVAADVGKMSAVKNKMPLIPQCPGRAQSAAAEMPGEGWSGKPTLLSWQSMRPHAELHQQPQLGNGHWNLEVWHSFQLTRAQKPSKVCAGLGGGGRKEQTKRQSRGGAQLSMGDAWAAGNERHGKKYCPHAES